MKYVRLPIQVTAILLQIYFFVETIRLYTNGYVMFLGTPVDSGFNSMLFLLLVVIACEVISFVEAILFVIAKRNIYPKLYMALLLVNAYIFCTMAFYDQTKTIICLSVYAVLFVFRIVNLILNSVAILKKYKCY